MPGLHHLWVIKEKPTGEGGRKFTPLPPPPTQIKVQLLKLQGLKYNYWSKKYIKRHTTRRRLI